MGKKLRKFLNKYPLWVLTAIVFTVALTLVIQILIANNYSYNRKNVIESHVDNTQQVLKLEMDTITQYVKDLTSFAIQPCYSSRFTRIIENRRDISDDDIDYVKDQMREYYFSRSDLNSYGIYFMNHDLYVGRRPGDEHMLSNNLSVASDDDLSSFDECSASKYFMAVKPAEDPSDFLTFYHSIIQIADKSSLAYVRCDIDRDFIDSLTKNYSYDEGELLLLYNSSGELLYSDDNELTGSRTDLIYDSAVPDGYSIVEIDGIKYMQICRYDPAYGLMLSSLEPYDVITDAVYGLFISCITQGIILWIIFTILMFIMCKWVIRPVNSLASKMENVGEGDFDTRVDINGCREIQNLGGSFNYMSERIQRLINDNYISKLNEQSSRLIALEAQINPHFLYNTLQAISTEALVNDQTGIHEMVISLASILRYSIKGGDLVTLSEEMEHVNQYIYLQKIRLEDNLSTSIDIDTSAADCLIPKLGIQTLIENSIVHGIEGDVISISISLSCTLADGILRIDVEDDGAGMSDETLDKLLNSFEDKTLSPTRTKGMGLANLYSRLMILYNGDSTLTIDTKLSKGTAVHITLPDRKD